MLNGVKQQPNTKHRIYLPFLDAGSKSRDGIKEKSDLEFSCNLEDFARQ